MTAATAKFAKHVQAACATVGERGRFGPRKVWIDKAHKAFGGGWTLKEFKEALLAAHREGDLELVRVDLAGATEPGRMQASEIKAGPSTYHLIRAEPVSDSVKRLKARLETNRGILKYMLDHKQTEDPDFRHFVKLDMRIVKALARHSIEAPSLRKLFR